MTDRDPRGCSRCDGYGVVLWKRATEHDRRVDIAYRCDCPAGERYSGLKTVPQERESAGR